MWEGPSIKWCLSRLFMLLCLCWTCCFSVINSHTVRVLKSWTMDPMVGRSLMWFRLRVAQERPPRLHQNGFLPLQSKSLLFSSPITRRTHPFHSLYSFETSFETSVRAKNLSNCATLSNLSINTFLISFRWDFLKQTNCCFSSGWRL